MKKQKIICALLALLLILSIFGVSPRKVSASIVPKGVSTVYYFSTSGDDLNPGTIDKPMKSLAAIPDLLKPGVAVLLKRGDAWYQNDMQLNIGFIGIREKEKALPSYLGAYGTGERPIIAAMSKFDKTQWKNESGDVYRLTSPITGGVFRLYINNLPLVRKASRNDLIQNTYCVEEGTVFIKHSNFKNVPFVEVIHGREFKNVMTIENVHNFTMENLDIKGGTNQWSLINVVAPTDNFTYQNCNFHQYLTYGLGFAPSTRVTEIHKNILIEGCIVDKGWTTEMNMEGTYSPIPGLSLGANGGDPYGDNIDMVNSIQGATVRNCYIANAGHTSVGTEIKDYLGVSATNFYGTTNMLIEKNYITRGCSPYARGFGISGSEKMCNNNIVRQNYFYDLTESSHMGGVNNCVYSNIFDTNTKPSRWGLGNFTGTKWPGTFVCKNNVIANNVFYGETLSIFYNEMEQFTADNQIVNNIICGWRFFPSWAGVNDMMAGMVFANNSAGQKVKNNGLWNGSDNESAIREGEDQDSVAAIQKRYANYIDNQQKDPKFVFANRKVFTPQNFVLSANSPYTASGISLANILPPGVPAIDFFGNFYDKKTPSAGAIQFGSKVPTQDKNTLTKPMTPNANPVIIASNDATPSPTNIQATPNPSPTEGVTAAPVATPKGTAAQSQEQKEGSMWLWIGLAAVAVVGGATALVLRRIRKKAK